MARINGGGKMNRMFVELIIVAIKMVLVTVEIVLMLK